MSGNHHLYESSLRVFSTSMLPFLHCYCLEEDVPSKPAESTVDVR